MLGPHHVWSEAGPKAFDTVLVPHLGQSRQSVETSPKKEPEDERSNCVLSRGPLTCVASSWFAFKITPKSTLKKTPPPPLSHHSQNAHTHTPTLRTKGANDSLIILDGSACPNSCEAMAKQLCQGKT